MAIRGAGGRSISGGLKAGPGPVLSRGVRPFDRKLAMRREPPLPTDLRPKDLGFMITQGKGSVFGGSSAASKVGIPKN